MEPSRLPNSSLWFPLLITAGLILSGCTGGAPQPGSASRTTEPDSTSSRVTRSPRPVADPPQAEDRQEQATAAQVDEGAAASAVVEGPSDQPDPRDWTYWRGPTQNGISYETGLPDDWDPRGGPDSPDSNVTWRRDDLGGISTPIVMKGKLYTIGRAEPETHREGEKVVCVDAETGETIWENRFNVWLSDVPDTRVGWSSVVGDPTTDRVYALGVCGYFQCLDANTGETLWDVPLHEEFGLLSTYGGRTNFPVIHEDLVIISGIIIGWGEMARPAHRFLGFDKMTGEVVWFSSTRLLPEDTTYSAPVLTVLNGQKALVTGAGDGQVWALQPRTGRPIWNYHLSQRGLNTPPLVVGDTVYMAQSEENIDSTAMGAVAAIDGSGHGDITKSGELWRELKLMVGKCAPLLIDNRLYCFDDRAKVHVLDPETGQAIVRQTALGTVMRSSPLYADGKIYALTANGRWYILKPDEEKGVETVSRGRLPADEEAHAAPICAQGRLYIRTTGALYCVQDPSKTPGLAKLPPQPEEIPVSEDPEPAQVQVLPAEVLMQPGQIQNFRVRLFNSRGQLLDEADAEYELQGPGQLADGMFLAPTDAGHSAAIIRARVGELAGQARVRIVPPLPWQFEFQELDEVPITWVGARYRHVLREKDGRQVMVKVTTIPKGTRSRCWMGPSDLSDYTIQADVCGAITEDKMPDIGLLAQGYKLDLQGAHQKLQIRSWDPQLRMAQTIDFPWQPEQWYTMKLRVSVADGQALVQGKLWPRDEQEPDQWTLEATDEVPNLNGSPGLYGNAKDAEIYLDNIQVFPNDQT